jgi:hypothetical protein
MIVLDANILIRHEVHALGFARIRRIGEQQYFLMGDAGRAVGHRRPDILCRKVRIILPQLRFGSTLGELAQD